MSKTYSLIFVSSIIILCLLKNSNCIGSATQGTLSIDLSGEKTMPALVQKEMTNKVKKLMKSTQAGTTGSTTPEANSTPAPAGNTNPTGGNTTPTQGSPTPTNTTPAAPADSGANTAPSKPITPESNPKSGANSSYLNTFFVFSLSMFAFLLI